METLIVLGACGAGLSATWLMVRDIKKMEGQAETNPAEPRGGIDWFVWGPFAAAITGFAVTAPILVAYIGLAYLVAWLLPKALLPLVVRAQVRSWQLRDRVIEGAAVAPAKIDGARAPRRPNEFRQWLGIWMT